MTRRWTTGQRLAGVWLVAAVGFAALLLTAEITRSPLDDPDQAYQRPGILDLGALPALAPPVTADIPAPGRPAVVFFTRPGEAAALCSALAAARLDADVVVVSPGGLPGCDDVPVVTEVTRQLAMSYRMREPAGGGAPVGYAVVDAEGQIRYRTLDPTAADELSEVRTILEAL